MKRILAIIIAVYSWVSVSAQSEEEAQKWMEFMTPSKVHAMMAKWDGEWNEEIKMWMAPGAPEQQMKSTCINKMILGGRYQESKHSGDFMGMPFEGLSTLAWDNARNVFVSTWIDNFGTGIATMEGTWDEGTKTATLKGKMTDPMTGTLTDIREVFRVVDDNTQIMEQYGVKDGTEYKTMEIKFTRKKK